MKVWKSFNFVSDGEGKMVSSIDITIGGSKAMSSTSSLSDMSDSDDDTNNTVQSQSNDFEAKKVPVQLIALSLLKA